MEIVFLDILLFPYPCNCLADSVFKRYNWCESGILLKSTDVGLKINDLLRTIRKLPEAQR